MNFLDRKTLLSDCAMQAGGDGESVLQRNAGLGTVGTILLGLVGSLGLSVLSGDAVWAEEIRLSMERREDPHVKPRLDPSGFAFHLDVSGYLQKLEPTTIRIETQQQGAWRAVGVEAGRYLATEYDAEKPNVVVIRSTLKFDLAAGDRRFTQEREAIQREVQKRAGGNEKAVAKVRTQVLLERIAALREENIKAGADKRGKAALRTPPLPRQALNFEKVDALERILREQCCWVSVAEVFRATGFQPPDEKEFPEFAASQVMAEEVRKAMMGIKFAPRHLSESQYKALEQGSHYSFSAQFVPHLPGGGPDNLWRQAPAIRLADGLVKKAALEGSLDRQRGKVVSWWRVDCETPSLVQPQMVRGDGDCFWTWVETPDSQVRYLRLLLHSPGSRYHMNLSLPGATRGEELTLFDGPAGAPTQGPF